VAALQEQQSRQQRMKLTSALDHEFIFSLLPSDCLMIVLHGKGDSLKPFRRFDQELGLKRMNYLLLNAPKKFAGGYSWYGEPPFQRQGVIKAREKMFDLLTELESLGWNPENIFLLGFSQGCLVAADFALHYPKKLGGVIGISGYFNFAPRWKKYISDAVTKTPWLLTHGHADQILPLSDTKYGVKKLRELGLKINWVESNKDHSFANSDYSVIRKWLSSRL
jgi:phospholipase/carboxylesterase